MNVNSLRNTTNVLCTSTTLYEGGEDPTLPTTEGEAGGHPAGRPGCSLQGQRYQRLRQESSSKPESCKQPGTGQPQPEAEGAGCQGESSSTHTIILLFGHLIVFVFFFAVSASTDAHLQQGLQPGEQQCQWEQGEPLPKPFNPARNPLGTPEWPRPALHSILFIYLCFNHLLISFSHLCHHALFLLLDDPALDLYRAS